jgi:hypothetical protein
VRFLFLFVSLSDYRSVETNMFVLVHNGGAKPLNHRDTETQRKTIDGLAFVSSVPLW